MELRSARDSLSLKVRRRIARRVAGAYFLFAGAWVLLSDLALVGIAGDLPAFAGGSLLKGGAFVVVTTALLYLFVSRFFQPFAESEARKSAESGRTSAEERYRALVEQSLAGIYVIQENRFRYVNPRFAEIFGFDSAAEIIDRVPVESLVAPENRALVLENLRRRLRGEVAELRYAFLAMRRDGRTIEVEVQGRSFTYDGKPAVIGLLLDISDRRRAETELRESESRFRQIAENIREVFWLTDPAKNQMDYVSPGYEAIWGRTRASLHDSPRSWIDAIHPEDRERVLTAAVRDQVAGGYDEEYRIVRPDGTERWIHDKAFPVRDASGNVVRIAGIAEDITERKLNEARIERLTRLRSALSDVNRAIVHAGKEDALFADICAIGVRHAEFVLAWIGVVDPGSGALIPAASAGEKAGLDYLGQIRVSVREDLPEGRGPSGTALREGRSVISNDFLGAAGGAPWRDHALAAGIQSSAAFPLRRAGKVVAILNVYSGIRGFFDTEITNLMEEMATDVSFSLDVLERERERMRAANTLRESEARFRAVLEQSIAAVYVIQDDRLVYANHRMREIFGYGPDEAFDPDPLAHVQPAERPRVVEQMRRRLGGEAEAAYSVAAVRKDGTPFTLGVHSKLASYEGRPAIIAIAQDITERARAEEQIRSYVARLEQAMRSTINVVARIGELRDPYTHGHEHRVGEIAAAIAAEMGLADSQVEGIRIAGYLHDVGKIGVPAEILAKPSRLTRAEFDLVKDHAQQSYDILKGVQFPWPVAEAAWQHHERLDGSGYPNGLKADKIILEARILSVADVVEAMSSHRPYRPGLGIEKALDEIEINRGRLYDPQAVDACLRLFRAKGYTIPS